MKKITSIEEIINHYDNFIIDQWGVMHDGTIGYDHAFNSINILASNNKNLFIISNSSKRSKSSIDKLPKLGFNKNSFIKTVTSGEMIWQLLKKKYSEGNKKNCFHIYDESKEDGLDFRDGLNLHFVEKVEEADLILACTPFVKLQPIDYIPLLEVAYKKELTMYCANPDFETLETNSNNNNVFCMGAIGEIYKKMGGNVIIKGKPDVSIYAETTNQINLQKKRTLAIGDSLFHDIQGANNFQIDSVLVKSGIHKDLTQINNLIKNHQIVPTYIIDKFSI